MDVTITLKSLVNSITNIQSENQAMSDTEDGISEEKQQPPSQPPTEIRDVTDVLRIEDDSTALSQTIKMLNISLDQNGFYSDFINSFNSFFHYALDAVKRHNTTIVCDWTDKKIKSSEKLKVKQKLEIPDEIAIQILTQLSNGQDELHIQLPSALNHAFFSFSTSFKDLYDQSIQIIQALLRSFDYEKEITPEFLEQLKIHIDHLVTEHQKNKQIKKRSKKNDEIFNAESQRDELITKLFKRLSHNEFTHLFIFLKLINYLPENYDLLDKNLTESMLIKYVSSVKNVTAALKDIFINLSTSVLHHYSGQLSVVMLDIIKTYLGDAFNNDTLHIDNQRNIFELLNLSTKTSPDNDLPRSAETSLNLDITDDTLEQEQQNSDLLKIWMSAYLSLEFRSECLVVKDVNIQDILTEHEIQMEHVPLSLQKIINVLNREPIITPRPRTEREVQLLKCLQIIKRQHVIQQLESSKIQPQQLEDRLLQLIKKPQLKEQIQLVKLLQQQLEQPDELLSQHIEKLQEKVERLEQEIEKLNIPLNTIQTQKLLLDTHDHLAQARRILNENEQKPALLNKLIEIIELKKQTQKILTGEQKDNEENIQKIEPQHIKQLLKLLQLGQLIQLEPELKDSKKQYSHQKKILIIVTELILRETYPIPYDEQQENKLLSNLNQVYQMLEGNNYVKGKIGKIKATLLKFRNEKRIEEEESKAIPETELEIYAIKRSDVPSEDGTLAKVESPIEEKIQTEDQSLSPKRTNSKENSMSQDIAVHYDFDVTIPPDANPPDGYLLEINKEKIKSFIIALIKYANAAVDKGCYFKFAINNTQIFFQDNDREEIIFYLWNTPNSTLVDFDMLDNGQKINIANATANLLIRQTKAGATNEKNEFRIELPDLLRPGYEPPKEDNHIILTNIMALLGLLPTTKRKIKEFTPYQQQRLHILLMRL